jgi:hypothetical protein
MRSMKAGANRRRVAYFSLAAESGSVLASSANASTWGFA